MWLSRVSANDRYCSTVQSKQLKIKPVWRLLFGEGGEDGNISAHFKVHVHFHDTEQRAQNSTSIIISMILFLVGEGGVLLIATMVGISKHLNLPVRVLSKSSPKLKDANTSIYIVQIKRSTIPSTDKSDFLTWQ